MPPPPAITNPSRVWSKARDAVLGESLYWVESAPIASNIAVNSQHSFSPAPANMTSCLPSWICGRGGERGVWGERGGRELASATRADAAVHRPHLLHRRADAVRPRRARRGNRVRDALKLERRREHGGHGAAHRASHAVRANLAHLAGEHGVHRLDDVRERGATLGKRNARVIEARGVGEGGVKRGRARRDTAGRSRRERGIRRTCPRIPPARGFW